MRRLRDRATIATIADGAKTLAALEKLVDPQPEPVVKRAIIHIWCYHGRMGANGVIPPGERMAHDSITNHWVCPTCHCTLGLIPVLRNPD